MAILQAARSVDFYQDDLLKLALRLVLEATITTLFGSILTLLFFQNCHPAISAAGPDSEGF